MKFMLSVPQIVSEPFIALSLLWLVAAVGRRLVRITDMGLPWLSPVERGYVYLALGAGFTQYFPLLLGAFGLLSAKALGALLGVLAVLLVGDLWQIARGGARSFRAFLNRRPTPLLAVWCALFIAFAVALMIRGLWVGSLGDDDGYHLLAPKRWLARGSLDYLPTYTHTNAPMGFEMLYAIALATGRVGVAKLLHFFAGLSCMAGIVLCARRLGSTAAGLLAISCLLFENPLFDLPVLLDLAYTDLAMCWLTVTSVLAWLAWQERPERSSLAVAALAAGFAASFKFTALAVGAGLLVLVFRELARRGRSFRASLPTLAGTAALSSIPILPWLWRNFRLTGNPLYPMLSSVFPTRDWSPEHGKIFSRYFRYFNWGQDYLLYGYAQRRQLLLFVSVLLLFGYAVAIRRVKRPVLRDLLVFSVLLVAMALPVTGLYCRFWLPATICTLLVAVTLVSERLPARLVLPAATAVLSLAFLKWASWARYDVAGCLAVELGIRQAQRDDPFWNTWRFINTQTPPSARVLMAGWYPAFHRSSGVAFWIDRDTYTADSHLQAFFDLTSWDAFVTSVRGAGIDYVVVFDRPVLATPPGFSDTAVGRNEFPFSRRLVERYGTLVFHQGDVEVHRLTL